MSHVLAKISGVSVEIIKKKLDEDAYTHAKHGLSIEHVWQNADNLDEVQFLFEADDLEDAKEFITQMHAEARSKNPTVTLPQMTFLEGEDDAEIDFELPEDEGAEAKRDEKDVESAVEKKASAQTKTNPQLPANSITIAATSAIVGVALGMGAASFIPCPATPLNMPLAETAPQETSIQAAPTIPTRPPSTPRSGTPATGASATTSSAQATQSAGLPTDQAPTKPDAPPASDSSTGEAPLP